MSITRGYLLRFRFWRRRAELNRCERFCRPLPNHSATSPYLRLEYIIEPKKNLITPYKNLTLLVITVKMLSVSQVYGRFFVSPRSNRGLC